jgi:hypothetical protein
MSEMERREQRSPVSQTDCLLRVLPANACETATPQPAVVFQAARRAFELTGTVQLTVQERDPQAGEGSPRLPSASKSEL